MDERDVATVFPSEARPNVVYLSPDSPNVLTEVRSDTAYVIGALVDRTVKRVTAGGCFLGAMTPCVVDTLGRPLCDEMVLLSIVCCCC